MTGSDRWAADPVIGRDLIVVIRRRARNNTRSNRSQTMKKLMWIVLTLIVLVVVGVTVFLMKLDGIIQHTVETQGSKQLSVPVKLGGANLSILGGNLSLKDFSLGSPQGY